MNDFGKTNRQNNRRAVDGFVSAGGQQQPVPVSRPHGLSMDRFRTTAGGRTVGNFKQREGYHPARTIVNSSGSGGLRPAIGTSPNTLSPTEAAKKPTAQSLLNMTLPGGATEQKQRNQKTKKGKGALHRTRKIILRSTALALLLVFIAGGLLFAKGYLKMHKVFKGGGTAAALQSEVKPELLKGEGDGRVNILLMGKGGDNHDGPDLTDTILVASIDPVNKTANLVSIPRDLWVTVPGYGSMKINAVYANAKYAAQNKGKSKDEAEQAGISKIEDVTTQVLGIPVHYYTLVDFDAFKQAVDTVGGVTITVPEDLVDSTMAWENKGSPYLARKGVQNMDGTHALMYVRSRHGSARGDFDRAERQRLFITALSEKVLSAGTYTNPLKISQLMSAFGDHVSTDLSVNDAMRLMTLGKGIGGDKITSIGLADPPNNYVTTDYVGNASVVRPNAGFGDYSQIQAYIRTTLRDPYIAQENAAISVLNGTDSAGLATKKSDELKGFGYNVTATTDAPTTNYQKTILVDLSAGKKPYTKNYLEKRLGVKAVTTLPDSKIQATGSDFVLILGQDATTTH